MEERSITPSGQEQAHRLQSIAAGIFARHGIDFSTARRGGGWSNATWIAGGLVLRLSTQPDNENLTREAKIAALLPPEVGYPRRIETGVSEGHAWMLVEELPGQCLGAAWEGLDWNARVEAVRGLWQKAQAVHTVSAESAAGVARTRAWFNSCDPAEADESLRRLVGQGHFTYHQGAMLRRYLADFWRALPGSQHVLVHGDLTFDNAMWHQGRVSALLDFEFALTAPVELDLNTLLCQVLDPDGMPPYKDEEAAGHDKLRSAAVEMARKAIDHPGGKELLLGYAVLLDLWRFELYLAHPEGEGPVETWDNYRRLRSLASGGGGWLRDVVYG